eukprot:GHVP01065742.1.p1 GENE.GHVP01065742.1~~GHVP01065742.1.p1  ORF type:complete len:148 (-),score=12.95 GHVP01065742.1:503-946(-)
MISVTKVLKELPCQIALEDPVNQFHERSKIYKEELATYCRLFREPSFNWTTLCRPPQQWENDDKCRFCHSANSDNGLHLTRDCQSLPSELDESRKRLRAHAGWRPLRLTDSELRDLETDITTEHMLYFISDTLQWMQNCYRVRKNLI